MEKRAINSNSLTEKRERCFLHFSMKHGIGAWKKTPNYKGGACR